MYSIVIVHFGSDSFVDDCILSIYQTTYNLDLLQIIIINNNISEFFNSNLKLFKNYKIINLKENKGPSYSRNLGVKYSIFDNLIFLDNDTKVDIHLFQQLDNYIFNNPSFVAAQLKLKLMDNPNKIDYVGEKISQLGFLVQIAELGEIDNNQYDSIKYTLAAKSAGMFIKREIFLKLGGFDQDFFIYVEETDLGFRLWHAGYKIGIAHKCIVFHKFGSSSLFLDKRNMDINSKYHGCKNYIMMNIKNSPKGYFFKILIYQTFLWMGLAFFSLIKLQTSYFILIFKGIFWNFINLKKNLKKRSAIIKSSKLEKKFFYSFLFYKKSLKYFVLKIIIPQKFGNAEGFFKNKKK